MLLSNCTRRCEINDSKLGSKHNEIINNRLISLYGCLHDPNLVQLDCPVFSKFENIKFNPQIQVTLGDNVS